jgi:hypothetical protein
VLLQSSKTTQAGSTQKEEIELNSTVRGIGVNRPDTFPAGTTIHTGRVGSQGGHFVGGTQQVVVDKPWLIEGVEVPGNSPLNQD